MDEGPIPADGSRLGEHGVVSTIDESPVEEIYQDFKSDGDIGNPGDT